MAIAGDVKVQLSSEETYVGLPVTIQLHFQNVNKHEPPELPDVDGLKIQSKGVQRQSSQRSVFNGRVSQSNSLVYVFLVTPMQAGEFVIPPITVSYDGRKELTTAIRIRATKSETGDLLFVEVVGDRESVYVGQPIDLTLKIWIKPFHDAELGVTLSEGNMWQLVSKQTDWGVFSDRMQELAENNQRPGGEEVQRKDADGNLATYYLYEIDASVYPQAPGSISGDDCRVVVQYPTELGRSRSSFGSLFNSDSFPFGSSSPFDRSFGSQLAITAARPIVADANVDSIKVKPVPTANRPSDYRGAVGKYEIASEAIPTEVQVGDPITLHITIAGDGPMDLLQPPLLSDDETLTANFKVSEEPLAGVVRNNMKQFTTTIRPLSEKTTEIPPIRLSYFDPDKEQFVAVASDPIAIKVEPAAVLALDSIVSGAPRLSQADSPTDNAATTGTEMANGGPILYPASELLAQTSHPPLLSLPMILAMTLPPLAFLLAALMVNLDNVLSAVRRRYRPLVQLSKQVSAAEESLELSQTVQRFLAHQWKLSEANELKLAGNLRRDGRRDLAVRMEGFFEACRRASSGVPLTDGESLDRLKVEAMEIASTCLEAKHHAEPRAESAAVSLRRSSRTIGLWLATVLVGVGATDSLAQSTEYPNGRELAGDALSILLDEANDAYARDDFATAAQKYQMVADSGVRNAKLYSNLASAYRRNESKGRAMANQLRAIKLDPDNPAMMNGWSHDQVNVQEGIWPKRITATVFSLAPRSFVLWMAIFSWILLWLLLTIRVLWRKRIGIAVPIMLLSLTLLFALPVLVHELIFCRDNQAVVIASEPVKLRSADSDQSPSVGGPLAETTEVTVKQVRGSWAKVRTSDAKDGWIPLDAIEQIDT
ncbi:hypothetical protein CA13_38830 [Planctomycetes bacterium CA13]|uniref:Uncharacterized protein n=1 Tax=Novipirellula herctigrandis TaxID=2527986 RepID=A0A5C5Z5E6_9BACT|nr:hypothetical protein CA13_38830 [Planctomycetes bacterium CA13]